MANERTETSGPSAYERAPRRALWPVRVKLLGGFSVSVGHRTIEGGTWRLRKAAALVKLLALAPGHHLHREQAMNLLWPDSGRKSASGSLRKALHAARRTFDPEVGSRYLVSEHESFVLSPKGDLWVDVEAFEEAAATARRARSPAAYRAALHLYVGDLLPEDRYEEWTETRRGELRRLHLSLLLELAGLYEERGEYGPALEALRGAIVEEPALEEAHAALMRLHALRGRRRDALRQYERLREALSRELAAEPEAATRRLREDIGAGRFPPPVRPTGPPRSELPDSGRHNLPAPRTSFVGRERERVEVKRALAMTRLLTFTGAGGSGKTRLALEVARDIVGAYPDGVWLVELAALSNDELVPQAVARALGVREQPNHAPIDTLVETLHNKGILLVLDNCEHLANPVASLLDTLLDSCPRLQVLATSRETLGLSGETIWRVSPLAVPDGDRLSAPRDLTRYDAARLFVDRARMRLPSFELTPENAPSVAEICRKLEGIPLAIELATARVGALSIAEISERLRDSLGLLSTGGRTIVPRQRTLRGTLDWSFELLSEPEQVVFGRLSVFAAGCTLEAAEAVAAGDAIQKHEVLNLLSRLADKSLVVAETVKDGRARYRMLEPVRQYARDRLMDGRQADAVRRRHAEFFLALAEEGELNLKGRHRWEWLERLDQEHGNFRAALSWTLEGVEPEMTLRIGGALGSFWDQRGYIDEGRRWLEAALAAEGKTDSGPSTAKALTWAAWLALGQGDYDVSEALNEAALELYRELGDDAALAQALYNSGVALMYHARFEQASPQLEEAATLSQALGDRAAFARTLNPRGMVALSRHDHGKAAALAEESMTTAREVGDDYGFLLSMCVGSLSCLHRGDGQRARSLLVDGLELSQQRGIGRITVYYLECASALASLEGRAVHSALLWGAAETLRETVDTSYSPMERHLVWPLVSTARARLGDEIWETEIQQGRKMMLEEAIGYALSETEIPTHAPPTALPHQGSSSRSAALTRREEEVAALVARGLTNRQAALELSISEHTAATHIRRILKKLGLHSRSQLATWITERGLPSPDQGARQL